MNPRRFDGIVSVAEEPWDADDSADLRALLWAELDERYDGAPTLERSDPIVVFLVARDRDGAAVACGGLQRLGPADTQLVDLFVVPSARGTGASVAVLRALEARARHAGLTLVTLVLGTHQVDAMHFFEREGYRRVPTLDAELLRYTRAIVDD